MAETAHHKRDQGAQPLSRFVRQGGDFDLPFPEANDKIFHDPIRPCIPLDYHALMPWGLKRYQEARCLHFVTFSCYCRAPRLAAPHARDVFEKTFEDTRRWYGFCVAGYVVMPEHVHLLLTEPERSKLSITLQMLKQTVARRLPSPEGGPFWQPRYYDFNVWSYAKQTEKLRYIHRNPVRRGLVQSPDDWAWSSFRHYLTGAEGAVVIESHWTARKRELMGAGIALGTSLHAKENQDPPPVAQDTTRAEHLGS